MSALSLAGAQPRGAEPMVDLPLGLLEALDEAIVVHAKDGRVLCANPAATRILEVDRDDLRRDGLRVRTWKAAEPNEGGLRPGELPLDLARATEKPAKSLVLSFAGSRGNVTWVSMSAYPLAPRSDDAAFVTTFRDVTVERQLEERLIAAEKRGALGRLAASVGHELNNPLTYVLGHLEALSRRLRDVGLDHEASAIDATYAGVGRIRALARDLRVCMPSGLGGVVPVDLRPLVESCTRLARAEVLPRARLVCSFVDTPPVLANESELAQALLHVLLAAAQSIPEGNPREHTVTVETRQEGGKVAILVRDTGPGLGSNNPVQLDGRLGLVEGKQAQDLAVCRAIVRKQGGDMNFKSDSGQGTDATIFLNVAPAAAPKPWRAPPPKVPSSRHRVLLIDDEPQIAGFMGECLEGCEVTIATSGADAIRILESGTAFDAVLCDLMMPDTSGLDVHDFVRRARPDLERHMSFISGGAYTPRALSLVAAAPGRCLEKPFSADELVDAVERTVAGRWF